MRFEAIGVLQIQLARTIAQRRDLNQGEKYAGCVVDLGFLIWG
jgi:hypothetical protein